jgi:hypothetical protein
VLGVNIATVREMTADEILSWTARAAAWKQRR